MKCVNHPKEKAVAVYKKVGMCKNCLVRFLVKVDEELGKRKKLDLNNIIKRSRK